MLGLWNVKKLKYAVVDLSQHKIYLTFSRTEFEDIWIKRRSQIKDKVRLQVPIILPVSSSPTTYILAPMGTAPYTKDDVACMQRFWSSKSTHLRAMKDTHEKTHHFSLALSECCIEKLTFLAHHGRTQTCRWSSDWTLDCRHLCSAHHQTRRALVQCHMLPPQIWWKPSLKLLQ